MGRDRWKPIERDLRQTAGPLIAGVDEVGRGPLAGPVVACACIMPPGERAIRGVDDSKQLTRGRAREAGDQNSRARRLYFRRRRVGPGDRPHQHLPRDRAGDATRAHAPRPAAAPRAHRRQADPDARHRAHGDRRRRRRVLLDRVRVDRREGDARPLDAFARAALPELPLGHQRRLRDGGASRGARRGRSHAAPSPVVRAGPPALASTSVGSRTSAPTRRTASRSTSPRSRCSSRRTSTRRQPSCDSPRRAARLGVAIRWSSRLLSCALRERRVQSLARSPRMSGPRLFGSAAR